MNSDEAHVMYCLENRTRTEIERSEAKRIKVSPFRWRETFTTRAVNNGMRKLSIIPETFQSQRMQKKIRKVSNELTDVLKLSVPLF